jgi:hypothetical protein
MARYAGGGKATVESCRSIDVLDWHRRGYLRSPRRFSWIWKQDGKRVASINVESESELAGTGRTGLMQSSSSPLRGRHVDLVAIGHGLSVRYTRTALIAGAKSLSSTISAAYLPAVIVLGLPTRASRNQPMNGAY